MRTWLLSTALTGVLSIAAIDGINAGSIIGEVKFIDAPPKLRKRGQETGPGLDI